MARIAERERGLGSWVGGRKSAPGYSQVVCVDFLAYKRVHTVPMYPGAGETCVHACAFYKVCEK
jgi:hypothetical protein